MKAKISFTVIVIMLVTSLVFVNFNSQVEAQSREIYVRSSYFGFSDGSADRPYKRIQEAIDDANAGDTIYVFGGLYQENIIIDKTLKIVGAVDEIETVIDSKIDQRYLIEVRADDVTLEGLTVSDTASKTTSPIGALIYLESDNNKIVSNFIQDTDSYGIYIDTNSNGNLVSKNEINNTEKGIYISSSATIDIIDNQIGNCSHSGIYLHSALSNNRLYGNRIHNCKTGIYVQNSNAVNISNNVIANSGFSGVSLHNSDASIIRNNQFTDNSGSGIILRSSSCIVSNNTFKDNQRGISIDGSVNTINDNRIHGSQGAGIYANPGSNNNIIYLNDFKNNGVSARELGLNTWYHNGQGNYWSDYNYVDREGDGIGDEIYSKEGVEDIYPLGYFLKPPKKPSNPSPNDFETGVGLRVTLQVHIEDPDSDELTVYFYKGDGTLIPSTTPNPVRRVKNNSIARCSFILGFNTTYAWYVVVNDSLLENQSDIFIFFTKLTPPDNVPPVANAGGPYYANVNETINFDSTGSHDPDGEIDFYRWNFGDGSSEILRENPAYFYSQEGEYTVILTVIDNNGSSTSDTTKVFVSATGHERPVANAVIPLNGDIGANIVFNSDDTVYGGSGTLHPQKKKTRHIYTNQQVRILLL